MDATTPSRRRFLGGALCLCCAPRPAGAGPLLLSPVAPGIFVRTGLTADATAANQDAIANLGCVIGADSVAVFDPGGSLADGLALRHAIRALTPRPVSHVILSHVHPDHLFGAAAFLPGAPGFPGSAGFAGQTARPRLVGHFRLPAAIAARGAFYQRGLADLLGAAAGPVPTPDLLVQSTLALDLGGRPLTLRAHPPAHTDADLTLFDHATATLFAGDLLFVRRVPVLDGDLAGWLALLDRLAGFAAQRAIPGHGPPAVRLADAIPPLRRYLTLLRDQTRTAIAAGTPIEQAAHRVAAGERFHWALFDAYNPRNVIEAYRQLEWE